MLPNSTKLHSLQDSIIKETPSKHQNPPFVRRRLLIVINQSSQNDDSKRKFHWRKLCFIGLCDEKNKKAWHLFFTPPLGLIFKLWWCFIIDFSFSLRVIVWSCGMIFVIHARPMRQVSDVVFWGSRRQKWKVKFLKSLEESLLILEIICRIFDQKFMCGISKTLQTEKNRRTLDRKTRERSLNLLRF